MYDVCGIGHALVDLASRQENSFLSVNNINIGEFRLIDINQAKNFDLLITPEVIESGGSTSNTITCSASFGAKTAYIGCVSNDDYGKIFKERLNLKGIEACITEDVSPAQTGRSYIIINPEGQRSMLSYQGVANNIELQHKQKDIVSKSKIFLVEGYLWESPKARDVSIKLAKASKKNGNLIAFSLSDSNCVKNNKEYFLDFIINYSDIILCNEIEFETLMENQKQIDLVSLLGHVNVIAVTKGKNGSIILTQKEKIIIEPKSVNIVNTTGAGDAYAGGFLYGLTEGFTLKKSGELGNLIAAKVVSHLGNFVDVNIQEIKYL
ncbi:MAG: hypothetical protein B7Y25_03115 [Alphaproteobacteria bacterium 16-39-46]|nr:MAG: hypothetical protein B7Y25_03115 [Alphaproteobacteria bacterium 16-39-46]OZA43404.1 MAG: hypothetical protein B7X84_03315 [Alphaproteobacteria bacterium 17-39-52]HQS83893.1 adenosine kinase [Alphaproteobacteria bacterium]HQS93718.1 adenosine kinase [Alphaproteobacteria bacterium]